MEDYNYSYRICKLEEEVAKQKHVIELMYEEIKELRMDVQHHQCLTSQERAAIAMNIPFGGY